MNQVFGLFNARTTLNDFLLLRATILSENPLEVSSNVVNLTFQILYFAPLVQDLRVRKSVCKVSSGGGASS